MTGNESEVTKQPSWWKRLWEGPEPGTGGQVAQQEVTQHEAFRWEPTRRQILLISSGIAAVSTISVLVGYLFGITLWDWVKLLIVPAAIAAVGAWFTWQQQAHQNRITQDQRTIEQALAVQRANTDREIEDQRRQDEALQAYLAYMSQVLTEREPPFDEGVRAVVRARTLALLGGARVVSDTTLEALAKVAPQLGKGWIVGGLDPERKQELVRFLYEADLIKGSSPIIKLQGALLYEIYLNAADFRDINLSGTFLRLAKLMNTDLSGADLSSADLSNADLSSADLNGANLNGANLNGANLNSAILTYVTASDTTDLSGADLRNADLGEANLAWTNLSAADLSGVSAHRIMLNYANLTGATMQEKAYLRGARLNGADLSNADLSSADLSSADLSNADLSDADLSGADLNRASLGNARGVTNDGVAQQASSLKSAIMPNGQTYEDWFKDKEGRRDDRENPSRS